MTIHQAPHGSGLDPAATIAPEGHVLRITVQAFSIDTLALRQRAAEVRARSRSLREQSEALRCRLRSKGLLSPVHAPVRPEAVPAAGAGVPAEQSVPGMSPADRKLRLINLAAVTVPFLALGLGITLSWGAAFDWTQFWIMTGMALATAVGVTVGFHRLATHKSFATLAPVRYLFAVLGSMAVQGPVIQWAGTHRRHHQHADKEEDPHSPHMSADGSWGTGVLATLRGAYHAHIGWLFEGHPKGLGRYTKDLHADRVLVAVNRQFVLWVLAGLALPALLGGLLTWSLYGAFLGFLWGGLVRVLVVHHITWSVNSICHLWGSGPFETHDHSRNNALIGILAMGEGWHNNHHAFPTSARHGLRWWELDLSYLLIRAMGAVGLAREIRRPAPERIEAKLRRPRPKAAATAPPISRPGVLVAAAAGE